jgi:PAS domain S-box-containing protein
MTDENPSNHDLSSEAAQAELAQKQALKYGKDLARIYVAERAKREHLELANQMLSAIFASTPDGLVVLDNAFIIQQANAAFARLVEWGGALESMRGQPVDSLLLSDRLIPALQRLAADDLSPTQVELSLRRPVRQSVIANMARLQAGTTRGWVIVLHDRSDLKRLEHQKAEFINIAAHELRTPLGAIMGFAELLERGLDGSLDTDQQRDIISAIALSARRLRSTVQEMIEFAGINRGDVRAAGISDLDLGELVDDLFADLRTYAQERQVSLEQRIDRPAPRMRADATLIRSLLYQLVLNGVNYNRPGGHVRIEAMQAAEKVTIHVIDSGIGIAQADLADIFQPFYRGRSRDVPLEGRLGLGLSIAQRATAELGGELTVQSALDVGTTFTLKLPARQPSSADEVDRLREELDRGYRQSLAYAHDLQALYRKLQDAHEQLKENNRQLEDANRLKSDFLGTIERALSARFVAIDLALQAFPRYGTDHLKPEQRELLDQMTQNFRQTYRAIDKVTRYATWLGKQSNPTTGIVNLSGVLAEAVDNLHPMATSRQVELHVEASQELLLPAGNADMLTEAIEHLLQNAIRHTPSGGQVTARIRERGNVVAVEVQDRGAAIPTERLVQIIEALRDLPKSLEQSLEALGVGLMIVRYAAAMHGGEVFLESEPGSGTIAGFWLPLVHEQANR